MKYHDVRTGKWYELIPADEGQPEHWQEVPAGDPSEPHATIKNLRFDRRPVVPMAVDPTMSEVDADTDE